MSERWTVDNSASGQRLDQYLQARLDGVSRSRIRTWIDDAIVLVNKKPSKAGYKLREGDQIEVGETPEPERLSAKPEPMELDIVYEDEDLAIINKPQGLVVHPSAGHPDGTLVNGLMYHFQGHLSGINGVLRPGIVHRIDKDTSGLLVICKSDRAHQALSEDLAEHAITRKYHAIVYGNIKEDEGTVDAPLGRATTNRKMMAIVKNGRRAVTHYRVLERFGTFTYIECELETGRTHQIRVHMKSLQHPVLGDPLYSSLSYNKEQGKRIASVKEELTHGQMLHAKVLGFTHPVSGQYMEWEATLPTRFEKVLAALRAQQFESPSEDTLSD